MCSFAFIQRQEGRMFFRGGWLLFRGPSQASNGSVPSRGFPEGREEGGDKAAWTYAGVKVPRDMDRAPELVPYRDLDPSRLKLSGKAQSDPSKFLDDALWMAFKEPGALCWTSEFNHDDIPDLEREDPNQILSLAKVWDVNGLLHLAPAVLEERLIPSCLRVFNCYKSGLVDRQIGDRRGRNQTEALLTRAILFLTMWLSPWSLGG